MKKNKPVNNSVALNRKAGFDVAVQKTYEAGLVLTGKEIKSIREKRITMNGAYVKLLIGQNQELPRVIVIGLHLSLADEPERTKTLLLTKKEIKEIAQEVQSRGNVIVPLRLYLNRGWAKLHIGMGTGRKVRDKRQLLKDRDVDQEQRRTLKHS